MLMEIKNDKKELYETPSTLVFEVKQEGVICASPDPYPQWTPEDI